MVNSIYRQAELSSATRRSRLGNGFFGLLLMMLATLCSSFPAIAYDPRHAGEDSTTTTQSPSERGYRILTGTEFPCVCAAGNQLEGRSVLPQRDAQFVLTPRSVSIERGTVVVSIRPPQQLTFIITPMARIALSGETDAEVSVADGKITVTHLNQRGLVRIASYSQFMQNLVGNIDLETCAVELKPGYELCGTIRPPEDHLNISKYNSDSTTIHPVATCVVQLARCHGDSALQCAN